MSSAEFFTQSAEFNETENYDVHKNSRLSNGVPCFQLLLLGIFLLTQYCSRNVLYNLVLKFRAKSAADDVLFFVFFLFFFLFFFFCFAFFHRK